ncbi:sugar ABC transporter ATP-binding protein [Pseudoduganella umbonata]|uniref:Ribose transport system ATP-binding protein n=1 Tax=Pseudoduganella umbonata TaxID=864828 RepID=A0A4P8HN21_9BURK|nr:sugar ABC transporter ATP-binding protein [Pseudoduganella umbonata]MBB3221247.1 ribose transport system ATP-binding protein [Pseudoduganella umbonata]QCP10426.1 sugar ABC transporter ATP-binding protein [Pseudoduganella umbonata]
MATAIPRPVLEVSGIRKRFGAVTVLDGVQLTIRPGEIHALMGENGAGKSTLMKILAGVYQPDAGEIRVAGEPVRISSPADARACGINLIYQELSVAPNLSVAQNIFMGAEPRGRFGIVDSAQMNRRAAEVLRSLGAGFAPTRIASGLSIADQQQVEIARALVHESRVLIMDEPTAALSERETERLFDVMRGLRARGIAIIYISHRMAEVRMLADRVTVLRDGTWIGELDREEATPETVVRMMVGRELGGFYEHARQRAPGAVRLELDGVHGGRVHPASLQVRAGEIVGLAGLVGAGRTELARLVFGADRLAGGTIEVDGRPVTIREPADAIRLGIAYVPEDRKGQGLFLQQSLLANVTMNVLGVHARCGVLRRGELLSVTRAAISRLSARGAGPEGIIGGLSGGNQQKLLLARWLAIGPRVLILDEPTRGVDIGAKHEIYRIIHELADTGVAVLCISSELAEIIGVCDRVLVMREGWLAGELQGERITQENIMALATLAQAA